MKMQIIKIVLPFIFLFSLLGLLGHGLFSKGPNELPSALIGSPLPQFQLPDIIDPQKIFTQTHLSGQVSLVNVWATWCYACEAEHNMLMKISEQYHVPIYGIAYKDKRQNAMAWLTSKGNPYVLVGDDKNGDTAIDFGVYGTPETFIISPQGKIVYRHIGVITQDIWDNVLAPLIKKMKT